MNICIVCSNDLDNKSGKYCSNKCQSIHKYNLYIEDWKRGKKNGQRGINTFNISGHIKKYLFDLYPQCVICGWKEKNIKTGNVPLEIDHIDGNYNNNSESNLRLICPNCHSLTSNFRNLNKGNGRVWRKDKYKLS